MRWAAAAILALAGVLASGRALAADVAADPTSYQAKLATLAPGDTLVLAPGDYAGGLSIKDMNGAPGAPITIRGPASGAPARFLARSCCNTVELENASYITIENLLLDGQDIPSVDAIKAGGAATSFTHHITVEGCTITRHDGGGTSQQTVGISTKITSWSWIIRDNVIDGAGTGMYLGNSDGSAPFIGGLIEGNLYRHTLGYNMEIKQQNDRPVGSVAGVPTDVRTTVVRDNVFLKENNPSPDGARPNLLVDGFPDTGPGSQDHYEIFGNFFFHNDDDALLQATGRVHVYDNIFVDSAHAAVHFMNHAGKTVIDAVAYNNTIYSTATGISVSNAPSGAAVFAGNAIFAATALSGASGAHDNATDSVANAGSYVTQPSITLGQMDFYPKSGGPLHAAAIDLSSVASDTGYDRDFNGAPRDFTYRGAYHGEGTNPGWTPGDGLKPPAGAGGASGAAGATGTGGGAGTSGAGTGGAGTGGAGTGGAGTGGAGTGGAGTGGVGTGGAGTGGAGTGGSATDSGCGCRTAGHGSGHGLAALAVLALFTRRRRHGAVPRRTGRPS